MMYPNIDPVAIHIGSWGVRWYGLAYLTGFFWVWFMGRRSMKQRPLNWLDAAGYESLLTALMLGVLLGGRFGYMVFYQWTAFCDKPLLLFKIWQGGMSFHGAVLGVLLAAWQQARQRQVSLLQVTDLILPWVPLGIGLGRLANFVNGELWGRPTHTSWGMIFPWVDQQLRHPSQLYEFALEGVLLSAIMYWAYRRLAHPGQISGVFLLAYGLLRFAVEFVRAPDVQLGFVLAPHLTMGQCLSVPMMIVGICWLKGWFITELNGYVRR